MNRKLLLLAAITIATPLAPAAAYFHAGGWSGDRSSWSAHTWRGGTASGGDGSWNATGARGGTASGGDGSWNATGYRGGTASGGGGSWNATGANGNHYYGGPDYYHGGYYGAYQFSQPTWDVTANHAGSPRLIGVRPDQASPWDQDQLAWVLHQWQGNAPWGGLC